MRDLASEHDAVLAELLQLGLAAARKVTARLEAAEDDEAVARLGHTFSRVARAVRQTVALREKLARDRRLADREARDEDASAAQGRRIHRRDQVKAAVERLIWTEHENDEDLLQALDLVLDEDLLSDTFGTDPLDTHIARICEDIGIPGPPPTPDRHPGRSAAESRDPASTHCAAGSRIGLPAVRDDEAGEAFRPSG